MTRYTLATHLVFAGTSARPYFNITVDIAKRFSKETPKSFFGRFPRYTENKQLLLTT
jgi:hypothetical protein